MLFDADQQQYTADAASAAHYCQHQQQLLLDAE